MTKQRWFARVVRFWDGLFSLGDGWLGRRRLRRKAEPFKHLRYHPEIESLETRWLPSGPNGPNVVADGRWVFFSAREYNANENAGTATITVLLDQASSSATITVNYATYDLSCG